MNAFMLDENNVYILRIYQVYATYILHIYYAHILRIYEVYARYTRCMFFLLRMCLNMHKHDASASERAHTSGSPGRCTAL
jgi:hypothetical protein